MPQTPVYPGESEASGERIGTLTRRPASTKETIPVPSRGEDSFRLLVDRLPDSILILRGETIIFANAAAATLHGAASAERLIGRNREDLVHPDDLAVIPHGGADAGGGESLPPVEIRGRRLDGSCFDAECRESTIAWDGEPATLLVLHDVTERKGAARAAREGKDLYRTLVDLSPDGIMVHTDGILVFANDGLAEIMGADSPDRLIGKRTIDFVAPEDRAFALERRKQAAAGTVVALQEARFLRLDGTTIHVERTLTAIMWRGKPSFLAVVRDITERKRVESVLAEKTEILETTFEHMSQGISVYDGDTRLIAFNRKFSEIFGFPAGFLRAGLSYEQVARFIAEQGDYGPGEVDTLVRERVERARSGEVRRLERRVPDGTVLSIWRNPLPGGGFVTTFTDITDIKQTEEELRKTEARLMDAIESIPEGFALFDSDDRLVLYNKIYQDMYPTSSHLKVAPGTRFEDIIRASAEKGLHTPAVGRTEEWIRERLEAHRNPRGPVEQKMSDGRWLRIEERKTREGGIVGIRTDITDMKMREEELRKAMEVAELASRSKSEFLANMSHELRTPLNAIIGFSEIMQSEMFGSLGNVKYKDYAADINQSGRHLHAVINDILDLAKIEAGKLDLHEETVDLTATIEGSMKVVKGRADHRHIAMSIQIAENLPHLYADERKVKQILINLLSNAIKFTPDGGRVTLSAGRDRYQGLQIAVADDGIGMASEDIPKVFKAFGQVDSALGRGFEGTGLGLPLTKSLIELHGGSLSLESAPGVGTTVTVRFPPARVIEQT